MQYEIWQRWYTPSGDVCVVRADTSQHSYTIGEAISKVMRWKLADAKGGDAWHCDIWLVPA